MQLSPATLSTITAILSAQGITVDHARLSAVLAPLTGAVSPSTVLQPGEEIWLVQGMEVDANSCKVESGFLSLETVSEEIAERIRDSRFDAWGQRPNYDELTAEDFDVLIVRKAVRPEIEEKFSVTL
jgi:hypothetical protein